MPETAFEDSIENFISQWRPYAASVQLFSRTEGNPLLECSAAGKIFHVLERTGPYGVVPGSAQIIVNAMTETVEKAAERRKRLEVTGLSRVHAQGPVLLRQQRTVVIDAGIPLIVSVFAGLPGDVAAGDWLRLDSLAPLHGFVTSTAQRPLVSAQGEEGL